MLYDMVDSFKKYLKTKFTYETVRTYISNIKSLLYGQCLNFNIDNFEIQKVIDILAEVKYKGNFSKYKNAFLHFCNFLNITLNDNYLNQIERLESNTCKKHRKLKTVDFETIDKKISRLKNAKLKLSYQTMLATGLRVSELAQITKGDCLITGDELQFSFIAKGGSPSTVKITKNEYPKLFESLNTIIQISKHKIFYSAIYLQTNAKKLGFGCHDLRRICSKTEYKKTKSKEAVRIKLRHSSIKTTNIYLKSEVKRKGA